MKSIAPLAVSLLSAFTVHANDLDVWSGPSPDKAFLAAERRIPDADMVQRLDLDGTRVVISSLDRSGTIGSVYASHEFARRLVTQIRWSPDSKFLLFTTSSSGGHSPWHFETYVFSISDRTFRVMDDLVGPITDPKLEFTPPDIVILKVRDYSHEYGEPGDSKQVRVRLSEVVRKMRVDE